MVAYYRASTCLTIHITIYVSYFFYDVQHNHRLTMPTNNPSNNVKHKINGFDVAFSRTKNKWQVKDKNIVVHSGNFKSCEKYCKNNKES